MPGHSQSSHHLLKLTHGLEQQSPKSDTHPGRAFLRKMEGDLIIGAMTVVSSSVVLGKGVKR